MGWYQRRVHGASSSSDTYNSSSTEEASITDPDESYYVEDELYVSDDEEDEEIDEELFCFEEMIDLKTIKKEVVQDMYWLNINSNFQKLCKCGVTKNISSLMDSKFRLENIKVEHVNSIEFKNDLKHFSNCIEKGR